MLNSRTFKIKSKLNLLQTIKCTDPNRRIKARAVSSILGSRIHTSKFRHNSSNSSKPISSFRTARIRKLHPNSHSRLFSTTSQHRGHRHRLVRASSKAQTSSNRNSNRHSNQVVNQLQQLLNSSSTSKSNNNINSNRSRHSNHRSYHSTSKIP